MRSRSGSGLRDWRHRHLRTVPDPPRRGAVPVGADERALVPDCGSRGRGAIDRRVLDDVAAAAESGHMTAAHAGNVAERAGAHRLLLTHLMPLTGVDELVRLAQTTFRGPIDLAREGYTFEA